MVRRVSWLLPAFAIASLNACTLESFEVVACERGETIGFRINPIDGWLRDYEPRPESIFVRTNDNRNYEDARVWETRLNYHGPNDETFESRPARNLVLYGQKFDGWQLVQPPKPLSAGQAYRVFISDGGHNGWAEFEFGKPLPDC